MPEPMRRYPSTVLLERLRGLHATLGPSDGAYVLAETADTLGAMLPRTGVRPACTACRAARVEVFPG